jgi:mTERF domain-containing protein
LKYVWTVKTGISRTELARLISFNPSLLSRSLEKTVAPCYDFLRSFLKTDEKVLGLVVRSPRIIDFFKYCTKPNIDHLRDNRVPDAKIAMLLRLWPSSLRANIKRFSEIVGFVKEKGLNPSNLSFVAAIAVVSSMSTPTWEKKVLLYESWGWSKEDIFGAFQKHPHFMMASESKINAVMDLLINKIGCKPSYIAQHPMLISFSLEKRTIPRSSVFKVLLSKDMVKLTCLSPMLKISDFLFEKKLLTKYKEEALDLLKLYREKMNVPK